MTKYTAYLHLMPYDCRRPFACSKAIECAAHESKALRYEKAVARLDRELLFYIDCILTVVYLHL